MNEIICKGINWDGNGPTDVTLTLEDFLPKNINELEKVIHTVLKRKYGHAVENVNKIYFA